MLACYYSDRGLALEDVHGHGSFALHCPAFDGEFVAHLTLLIAAL